MKKLYKKISNYFFDGEMPLIFPVTILIAIIAIIISLIIA